MKEKILQYLIGNILSTFLANLDQEELKIHLDNIIDNIEITVTRSENKYDDSILPILRFARDLFDIPDLPD